MRGRARLVSFLLAALCLLLSACGQNTEAKWQEQYDLGVRYLSEGNYEEAIIAFTAAIEIDPNRAEAYMGRGDAYIGSGETEDNLAAALADYEEAVALDETNAAAWLGLADVYIRQMDYDAAIEVLNKGYSVTDSQKMFDLLTYLEEICEDQWLFTDNIIKANELIITGIPFWELSIERLAESFPSDEEFIGHSWFITESGKQYTQVRDGKNILSVQQGSNSQGIDYIQLWEYSELRDIRFMDDLPTVLTKLGISADGIEYARARAEQGQQIVFVNQQSIWSENELAGPISPGSKVEFIWVSDKIAKDLFLELNFDKNGHLDRIVYQVANFD